MPPLPVPPVATLPLGIPSLAVPPEGLAAPPVNDAVPSLGDVVLPPQATAIAPRTWAHPNCRLNDPRATMPASKPLRRARGNSVARQGVEGRAVRPGHAVAERLPRNG